VATPNTRAKKLARALMRARPGLRYTEALVQVRRHVHVHGDDMDPKEHTRTLSATSRLGRSVAAQQRKLEAIEKDLEEHWPLVEGQVRRILDLLASSEIRDGRIGLGGEIHFGGFRGIGDFENAATLHQRADSLMTLQLRCMAGAGQFTEEGAGSAVCSILVVGRLDCPDGWAPSRDATSWAVDDAVPYSDRSPVDVFVKFSNLLLAEGESEEERLGKAATNPSMVDAIAESFVRDARKGRSLGDFDRRLGQAAMDGADLGDDDLDPTRRVFPVRRHGSGFPGLWEERAMGTRIVPGSSTETFSWARETTDPEQTTIWDGSLRVWSDAADRLSIVNVRMVGADGVSEPVLAEPIPARLLRTDAPVKLQLAGVQFLPGDRIEVDVTNSGPDPVAATVSLADLRDWATIGSPKSRIVQGPSRRRAIAKRAFGLVAAR